MARWPWWIGGGAAVIIGLGAVLTQFQKPFVPKVPMAVAQQGTLTVSVSASGSVNDPNTVQLAPGTAGQLTSLTAQVGEKVRAGEVLGQLSSQTAAAQAASQTAQVANARAALASSQAHLAQLQNPPTATQKALDQSHVDQAQTALQAAEVAYTDAQKVYNATTPVTSSYRALQQLKQQLDQAQTAMQTAQSSYDAAVAQMQNDLAPSTPTAIAQAQAAVSQAQAQYQSAQAQEQASTATLAQSTLTAPVTGMVTAVNAAVGAQVNPQTPVVTILPQPMQLQVVVDVPEVEIGQIRPGQAVDLTTADFPGRTYHGRVTVVAATPQTIDNVTEYPVYVQFTGSASGILPGMSMNADLITSHTPPATLIPALALMTVKGQTGVYRIGNGGYRFVPVQVLAQGTIRVAVRGIPTGTRVALLNPNA